jgi:p-hydroxybenzoate 3-monooxygenase
MTVVTERTQVAIVGAGPAGLMLSHLLALEGIESVVLEQRSREYCFARVRAGVLEHDVAQLIRDTGAGERMDRDGLFHEGIELQVDGVPHRVDFAALTGKGVMVYGQQELTRDLIEHREAAGGDLRFEATDVALHDVDGNAPSVTFRHADADRELRCAIVAGCDGFHGVCRDVVPSSRRRTFEASYPFAWLGILAHAAPATDELIYASHERGFALYSMRSPAVSRLYLQVAPDTDIADWPDDRIWDELDVRFARRGDPSFRVGRGATIEKSVTPMRSFVSEPMQHGRLYLAGDAGHIVPPTGAKGLNLAIRDVHLLATALTRRFAANDASALERYTDGCLARIWRAEDFSMFMTRLLHRPDDAFERRTQLARLRYVCASEAAQRSLAENYVGLSDIALEPPR